MLTLVGLQKNDVLLVMCCNLEDLRKPRSASIVLYERRYPVVVAERDEVHPRYSLWPSCRLDFYGKAKLAVAPKAIFVSRSDTHQSEYGRRPHNHAPKASTIALEGIKC